MSAATPKLTHVFVVQEHVEYEGSDIIGVRRTLEEAKQRADETTRREMAEETFGGITADEQTIHAEDLTGGRLNTPNLSRTLEWPEYDEESDERIWPENPWREWS